MLMAFWRGRNRFSRGGGFAAFARITFIALPLGSVMVLAQSTFLRALGLSLLILFQQCLVCLLWAIMPELEIKTKRGRVVRAFGWTYAVQFLSVAAGHALHRWAVRLPSGDISVLSLLAVLSVLLFLLVRTYFMGDERIAAMLDGLDGAAEKAVRREKTRLASFASFIALSPREMEVFGYWIKGASSKEIARTLVLSNETVKTHVKHIYRKAGVSGRRELIDALNRHRPSDAKKG